MQKEVPPSARCPRDARWVLGDSNFVQKEVDSSTCNFGTSSKVLSRWVFYTLSSSDIFFTGICRVVSPGLMR